MARKLAIVGTNGLPGNYGGWDQLVKQFSLKISDDIDLVVFNPVKKNELKCKQINKAKLVYVPFRANGWQSIPFDGWSLIHAAFTCDVIFVCGISGAIFFPFVRVFNKKIVLNPDGSEWRRSKWALPVKLFLRFSEWIGVHTAHAIVADNKIIQEDLLRQYNINSKCIEYGSDHVKKYIFDSRLNETYGIFPQKYAFKVCRIEPENNIEMILSAFSEFVDLPLVLIGNWNNSQFGTQLRKKYKVYDHLTLLDPIYDECLLNQFRSNCAIYVHGHSVGGTNPSLLEAMGLGLNILAYAAPYNIETTEGMAAYFSNKQELLHHLHSFELAHSSINKNGNLMFEIAQRRYQWIRVIQDYEQLFLK